MVTLRARWTQLNGCSNKAGGPAEIVKMYYFARDTWGEEMVE
jgi:hypothetical protein